MPGDPNPAPSSSTTDAGPGRPLRLGVLFGGRSAEHDVSCVSARHVLAAVDPSRFRVDPIGITRDGTWVRAEDAAAALAAGAEALPDHLTAAGPTVDALPVLAAGSMAATPTDGEITVVFPVLHGPLGEDGTMQGLLELAGVPYVGAGVLASALCMDKIAAKDHLRAHGLPQGTYRGLIVDDGAVHLPDGRRSTVPEVAPELVADLGLPLFVKPANMGSSVGVSRAVDLGAVVAAIEHAASYDQRVIVEEAVRGREIEVAVLGDTDPEASLPGEIRPGADFYDYSDKYDDGAELLIPADLHDDEVAEVQALAIRTYRALGVEGLARVDFFYEDRGRDPDSVGPDGTIRGDRGWLVGEINTMPGFTPISMYPKMWTVSGLPYPALIETLVDLAIARHQRRIRHTRTDH